MYASILGLGGPDALDPEFDRVKELAESAFGGAYP